MVTCWCTCNLPALAVFCSDKMVVGGLAVNLKRGVRQRTESQGGRDSVEQLPMAIARMAFQQD